MLLSRPRIWQLPRQLACYHPTSWTEHLQRLLIPKSDFTSFTEGSELTIWTFLSIATRHLKLQNIYRVEKEAKMEAVDAVLAGKYPAKEHARRVCDSTWRYIWQAVLKLEGFKLLLVASNSGGFHFVCLSFVLLESLDLAPSNAQLWRLYQNFTISQWKW